MWLTSGRASGPNNIMFQYSSSKLLNKECYEEEVQPHRKTENKPMTYITLIIIIDSGCFVSDMLLYVGLHYII